jgi:hypothetical protein
MYTDYIWGESFTNLKSYTINEIKMALEITASYLKVISNTATTSKFLSPTNAPFIKHIK